MQPSSAGAMTPPHLPHTHTHTTSKSHGFSQHAAPRGAQVYSNQSGAQTHGRRPRASVATGSGARVSAVSVGLESKGDLFDRFQVDAAAIADEARQQMAR